MDTRPEELAKLGSHLKGTLKQFITDREPFERQWLINLRQYLGQYDPEVKALIPEERSHVYPRDTRVKVKGGVAKMMEMMFPSQERNWSLSVSPNPSIPKEALEAILAELQMQSEGQQVPSEAIERAVRAFAEERKNRMEAEIADQLSDAAVDYPQLCKKVVRSGYLFGPGIVRCPMVRTQKDRVWEINPATGQYEAKVVTKRRPYPEYVRIWDFYPDLSAKSWEDQEMMFERFVLTRHDFRKLASRNDFISEAVRQYLKEHPTGNYVAKTYETDLQVLAKTTNLAERTSRRYELYRGLGFVSAHDLQKVGVEVKESELDEDILADLWFIDDVVIKAEKAAFGDRPSDQYHAFIYTEDEDSGLTGVGLPEEVRDSQMSLCASTRALMDNMAATAGPILEVNKSLLPMGRKSIGPIHAFMTIEREGDGIDAQYQAVRAIVTPSHIGEILNIIQTQRQQLDIESNLPAFTMGGMQQPLGEAFRTSNNMSMMMGGANMVTKDTVRAFDKFTASVINAMLRWNMEFNPDEKLKGDYQALAKGNISLVAKEVRGAALDQFVMTLTPEERIILDTYGLLVDRLKARDLPTDRLLPEGEARAAIENMRAAQAQAAQVEQGLTQAKTQQSTASAEKASVEAQKTSLTTEAVIQEMLSRVEANLALAQASDDKTQLENLRMLLETATKKEQSQ
jgi:metal-responsive CopG/Arc/MetJ family transcriptional regulator